jgi:hypothetical protein
VRTMVMVMDADVECVHTVVNIAGNARTALEPLHAMVSDMQQTCDGRTASRR